MRSIAAAALWLLGASIAAVPATAVAAEARQQVVRSADGVPIAYDVRGKGNTAVVLVHCWACDRSFWRGQADALASRHRVVTLDLAGHGASGDGRARFTVAGLGGDVQAVVEALKLSRVVLVGHSMGALVALDAARRMPGRVAGVVAVDSLHDVEQRVPRETAEKLAGLYEEDFRGTMTTMVQRMLPRDASPAVVEFVTGHAAAARPGPPIALLRDYPDVDAAAWMEAAKVPVRAINSGPPVSPVTKIGHNRRHGDYDVSFMDGTGHYPMLERPAEFNRRLEAAVSEVLAVRPKTGAGARASHP